MRDDLVVDSAKESPRPVSKRFVQLREILSAFEKAPDARNERPRREGS